mgnify:CR=1 FL=1|tara:strand:- start:219 stop:416 length:198 start_codon:yes stop_codon:yes gene_type:complete
MTELHTEKQYHDMLDNLDDIIFKLNLKTDKTDKDLEKIARTMTAISLLHDEAVSRFENWSHYETK